MKKYIYIIGSIILIGCAGTNPYLRQAKIYYSQKNFETLKNMCEEWTEKEPNNPESYLWLGRAYAFLNKFIESAKNFEKGLNLAKEKTKYLKEFQEIPTTYYNAGIIYAQHDSIDKAINYLSLSYSLDTTNAQALLNIGSLYQRKNDDENAKKYITLAYKKGQDIPDILYYYALYIKEENPEECEKVLKKLIEIEKGNARGYALLGEIYILKKEYKKASEFYKKAYELDTLNLDNLYNYSFSLLQGGEVKEAIYHLENLKSKRVEDANVYFLLGTAYEEINDLKNALNNYEKATILEPERIDFLKAKAALLIKMGKQSEAYKVLLRIKELEGKK
ncbi:MAG: hypothetical protein ABIM49_03055 [candidate division WOR-3 bacterium]